MYDNLNNYKVFLTVANTGSISNAANALFISQPAVSKSVSNLEEGLGVSLFIRNSRGVTLTDEGKILYEHVNNAFNSISQGEDELKRINELGIGQLKIGVSTSLCKHILLDYLQGFINEYPHIKMNIYCHSTANTIKLLDEGKIDLGLICHTELPRDMEYIPLKSIHDVFVTSTSYLENLNLREKGEEKHATSNPWLFAGNITSLLKEEVSARNTKKESMPTNEILEKSNLMLLEPGNVTRNHIDRYMLKQNIFPSQILEINNMDLLIDFAAIGMGVSSVVREFAEEQLKSGQIVELPLDTPIPERNVGFLFHNSKNKSAQLEKFLNYCNLNLQ